MLHWKPFSRFRAAAVLVSMWLSCRGVWRPTSASVTIITTWPASARWAAASAIIINEICCLICILLSPCVPGRDVSDLLNTIWLPLHPPVRPAADLHQEMCALRLEPGVPGNDGQCHLVSLISTMMTEPGIQHRVRGEGVQGGGACEAPLQWPDQLRGEAIITTWWW